jgi:DNA-binding GntR family transcriptional regulator
MKLQTDFRPKYQQLASYILKNIQEGTWPVGTPIPSEMHLVGRFSLSRNTVREAIKQLELSGYIYRIHGKGSFVSTARLNQRFNNLTSFSKDVMAAGMTPGHRNLDIRKMRADEAVSMKLHVPLNSECLFLHRLLLADDLVFIVVKTYFAMQWLEMSGITITSDTLGDGSLYDFFSNTYGISFTKATIIARAVRATSEESRYLGIPKGSPILATERLAYTPDNIPRELTFGAGHPDRHQWSMTVYKDVDASGGRGLR